MYNSLSHIRCLVKNILLLAILIFTYSYSYAQDEFQDSLTYTDTSISITDSVYVGTASEPQSKFDSITNYDIPSYQAYPIPDSVLSDLKKDDAFWYANKVPKRQKADEIDFKDYEEPFYAQNWFRTLLWIIIIGAFIAVLVWFLIASDVRLFRKKATLLQSDHDINVGEDIFSINYEEELQKAIANKNYPLGVRLMYLHVLRLFSDRNIIHYKIERTNSDYLLQLYNTSYYKDFFRLTRNFEYVWYGKFDISPEAFNMIGQDYTKLKAAL